MSAWRNQNTSHPHGRTPSYYANHNLYPGSYGPVESQTRISRRIHDGFSLVRNYGLDTTSDDVNSSIYSSPYYINGRYNSDNLTTQRANSASVQGVRKLFLPEELIERDDIELTQEPEAVIEMWQGKQIRFWVPYTGKVVGNQIILRNTGGSTGILSMYFSAEPDGPVIYETAIDLCEVSQDAFEKKETFSMTVFPDSVVANKRIYVRMEIWNEISQERSANPFNTGRKIEIAATGLGNHEAAIYALGDKNVPVDEQLDYKPFPGRPQIGLVYSDWHSVPVDRIDNMKVGGQVSYGGLRYDIFCVNNGEKAYLIGYDHDARGLVRKWVGPTPEDKDWRLLEVDSRATQINIAQASIPANSGIDWSYMFVVDGYSPLRRMRINGWDNEYTYPSDPGENIKAQIDESVWFASNLGETSGMYVFTYNGSGWNYNDTAVDLSTYGITIEPATATPSVGSTIDVAYTVSLGGQKKVESVEYVDARPVVGASLIMFHNNRLYLSGFRNDPNLVQCSTIEEYGPNFSMFPYRFYTPNRSPYDNSLTPITAMVEYASDQIMFIGKSFFSIFRTYSGSGTMETSMPSQVSSWIDSAGAQAQGDVCNYKGIIYSYDVKEGIRRFTGATWNRLPTTVDSHYDRVDMSKPRKLWGYANKLYFNYTDSIDHKAKCLVWDMEMNYQQYPWFQDVDIPFCDARWSETEEIVGIHPDYPVIMEMYAEDTWRRLDTPITFRRDTKFLSMPGNSQDFTANRFHAKVINDTNRWWFISFVSDKQNRTQFRGHDSWYRQPVWDTITVKEPVETPFPFEDTFEENAVFRMSITGMRIRASAIQARIMTRTFRRQANLVSTEFEVAPKNYI